MSYGLERIKEAFDKDLFVVLPLDNILQIDLDEPYQEGWDKIDLLANELLDLAFSYKLFPLGSKVTKSPGGNTHVYVKLDLPEGVKIPYKNKVAYQILLGSDLKREMLLLQSIIKDREIPGMLFETEDPGRAWGDLLTREQFDVIMEKYKKS